MSLSINCDVNNISKNEQILQTVKNHCFLKNLFYKGKRHLRASSSVEAAVIMPLVMFICVMVLLFFRVLSIEWGVNTSLQDAARWMALFSDENDYKGLSVALAEEKIYSNGVPTSYIRLGQAGINLLKSSSNEKDIELVAEYSVPIPADFFGLDSVNIGQRAKAHRWVGFDPKEGVGQDNENVYVTTYGKAYHTSLKCHYLDLSISSVSSEQVSHNRNASGHKYYPCPLCAKSGMNRYFITDYGENYHTSLTCSGLKRSIRTLTKSKAEEKGYHACGKCRAG